MRYLLTHIADYLISRIDEPLPWKLAGEFDQHRIAA